MAHSLPKMVPDSPGGPKTPRTPRTPGRQDPSKMPRFYPVIKEGGTIDEQVRTPSLRGFCTHDFVSMTIVIYAPVS